MSKARKNNRRKREKLLLVLQNFPTDVLQTVLEISIRLTHGKQKESFRSQIELLLQQQPRKVESKEEQIA